MSKRQVKAKFGSGAYRAHITHPPLYRTRIEWLVEPAILGNHAAIRLAGIKKMSPRP